MLMSNDDSNYSSMLIRNVCIHKVTYGLVIMVMHYNISIGLL